VRTKKIFTASMGVALLAMIFLPVVQVQEVEFKEMSIPYEDLVASDDYTAETVTFIADDGVKLTGHVLVPCGPAPEGGFPVVVFIHSWMFNQIQYIGKEAEFAQAGYITCAYDTRGWGLAGGKIGTAGPLEMQDLSLVIDWLIENTPADPGSIGVIGISYGGGHSLLSPAFDDRVKTVVGMSGWSDLTQALLPNGSPKTIWSTILVLSATVLGRVDPEQWEWLLSGLLYTPDTKGAYNSLPLSDFFTPDWEETYSDLWDRSPMKYIDEINESGTPIFIINGLNDDLLSSGQMVRFFEKLEVPKKMILANGVHASAESSGLLSAPNELWDDAMSWFDYWLRSDNNGIMEPAVKIYQNWDNTMGEFTQWPVATDEMTLYLHKGGALMETAPAESQASSAIQNALIAPATSGIAHISPMIYSNREIAVPGAPNSLIKSSDAAVSFETEVLSNAMTILGTPDINLWVNPSRKEFQVNLFFYDVDERDNSKLISHATYSEMDANPSKEQLVCIDCDIICHQLGKGHKLRVVISTSDVMYALPLLMDFRADILHDVQYRSSITLPLIDAAESDTAENGAGVGGAGFGRIIRIRADEPLMGNTLNLVSAVIPLKLVSVMVALFAYLLAFIILAIPLLAMLPFILGPVLALVWLIFQPVLALILRRLR